MGKKLTIIQKKWLFIFHLLFMCLWIGGGAAAIVLTAVAYTTTKMELIYPAHQFAKYIDLLVTIPGATGTLITGIWLSLKTNWGLTKHYWIIVKLVGSIAVIIFGANFMRFRLDDAIYMSANDMNFLQNPVYLYSREMILFGLIGALAVVVFLLIISIIKPWGKRD